MLDLTSDKGRYIAAALALAAEKPWHDVTLADIAERAGSSLVALKAHFDSRSALLADFTSLVDDEMLRRAPKRAEGQAARDALFEVIMSRFDILAPYKAGLKSIIDGSGLDLQQFAPLIASQRWMLEAAGVSSGGVDGAARALGLASVYAGTLRVWLDDPDAGMARTMATLDRRLRRGERTLQSLEGIRTGATRFASALCGALRTRREPKPADPAPASPPTP